MWYRDFKNPAVFFTVEKIHAGIPSAGRRIFREQRIQGSSGPEISKKMPIGSCPGNGGGNGGTVLSFVRWHPS
jgi:hypothetical protein